MQKDLAPDTQKTAERIRQEITHISKLLDDITELSRVSGADLQIELEQTDMAKLVTTAADNARRLSTGHTIETSVAPGLTGFTVDQDRIMQVLDNLLANAIKYSPAGGKVTVSVRMAGSEAVVGIRDEGMGIAPDEAPHIFERFYRSGRAKEVSRGTRLGLAICKRIVEQHGGTIWFESRPNQGATFFFSIPAGIGEAGRKPAAPAPPKPEGR